MIDFKEELKKYKPALEIEDIQNSIDLNEIQDLMEILQYITESDRGKEK